MYKLNSILIDFIFNDFKQSYLAEKYKVTDAYISIIKKRLEQLKYKPLIKDKKILCLNCKRTGDLLIHHNHNTGQPIALICRSCNQKIGNKNFFENGVLSDNNFKKPIYTLGVETIQIHKDTQKELTELKIIPRETYNDIIKRLIKTYKIKQEE